jgi:hypothetical protein
VSWVTSPCCSFSTGGDLIAIKRNMSVRIESRRRAAVLGSDAPNEDENRGKEKAEAEGGETGSEREDSVYPGTGRCGGQGGGMAALGWLGGNIAMGLEKGSRVA